ncbi:MAG: DEAD/DEAH box helicase, partial [Dehalococcoidia bacterium]
MKPDDFLNYITSLSDYEQQIVHIQYIPRRSARSGQLEKPLTPSLKTILESSGIASFYSHQVDAINLARNGSNVMVATASASGKTLCYNVPVLDTLINNRISRALYLFPTKALAQDQLRGLTEMAYPELLSYTECSTFDGDTPQPERAGIRKHARIIITNPDMLHLGILPNHKYWTMMLQNLKYVVVDEAHVYRGVFGSHVANVLRRLRRLCTYYGSAPQFICSSATIANPGEHAEKLAGVPFEVVDDDGAPYGGKRFVFWNPPVIDEAKSTRRRSNSETTFLFTELIRHNIRSLVFARTRKLTELIYVYSCDKLIPSLADRIKPYRAGYLPEDRRKIEKALFTGELLGVIATNALELGIDIGNLDATVLNGYPGSISSTWQQAGRSGRRNADSLSFFVALDNPLDQFFMNNPDSFFGKTFENALINAENMNILKPHLLCAAWEKPLSERDYMYFGDSYKEALTELEEEGMVRNRNSRWHVSPRITHPAQHVNIRSASNRNYSILDESQGYTLLETVESGTAFFQIHEGAIYLHQGDAYFIKTLDIEKGVAIAEPAKVPYYTQTKEITELKVLNVVQETQYKDVTVSFGLVDVTNMVIGYRKKMQYTEEVIGDELLDLPPMRFYTEAVWFDLPQAAVDSVIKGGLDFAGGLHATEHAAIALLPLFALCDRNDIGGVSTPFHPDTGKAQVFIYDAYPGGIGIARKGFDVITQLWAATSKAIEECPCLDGCPSCIQSPKCGNNNDPLDKKAAIILLRA